MTLRRRAALAVLAAAAFAVFVLPASPASAVAVRQRLSKQRHREQQPDRGRYDRDRLAGPGGTGRHGHAEQPDPDGQRTRRHLRGRLQPRPADGWARTRFRPPCRRSSRGPTQWRASSRRTFVATSISTTISDPDGTPSTGDETATDGSFTVVYTDMTFTAGPSGHDRVPRGHALRRSASRRAPRWAASSSGP